MVDVDQQSFHLYSKLQTPRLGLITRTHTAVRNTATMKSCAFLIGAVGFLFSTAGVQSYDLAGIASKLSSTTTKSILSIPFDELSELIGGSGRAKIMWDSLKAGENPLVLPVGQGLSERVRASIPTIFGDQPLISTQVSDETLSDCGTRKFLQKLGDGLSVESVLIPAHKFGRTTLCVSTQIGCDRGCAFCLTGKMGLIRNLTSSEIVSQVWNGLSIVKRENMPPMTNVVFMGKSS